MQDNTPDENADIPVEETVSVTEEASDDVAEQEENEGTVETVEGSADTIPAEEA